MVIYSEYSCSQKGLILFFVLTDIRIRNLRSTGYKRFGKYRCNFGRLNILVILIQLIIYSISNSDISNKTHVFPPKNAITMLDVKSRYSKTMTTNKFF